MDVNGLKNKLESSNQGHLLQYWDKLSEDEKKKLYKELNSLNYEEINRYFKAAMESLESASEKIDDRLHPLPANVCGSYSRCDKETLNKYNTSGKTCTKKCIEDPANHNRYLKNILSQKLQTW